MLRFLPLLLAAPALGACGGSATPAGVDGGVDATAAPRDEGELRSDLGRDLEPQVSDAELAALVAGNRDFAAALYGQVRTEPGNLFLSPHSISTALAMAYAGATGETATALESTLHFAATGEPVHRAFNRLDLALAARATAATGETRPFRLVPVNALWGAEQRTFEPTYLDALAIHYGAGLRTLDFAADPEAARATINDWVADRTEDRIRDLLEPDAIDGATPLVLTNAIYFSAAWKYPFDEDDTAPAPFATASGAVQVPTLHGTATLGHGTGDGFQVVELPYDGDLLSMVVVVPTGAGAGALAELEAGLDGDALAAITAAIQPTRVALRLPAFAFTAKPPLDAALRALGMGPAYDGPCFRGITAGELCIGSVVHQAFVAIDEAGTEAAAATAVIFEPPSAPPEPIAVAVDRPFLFFIRDIPTGAILFLGRVADPRG
jgi:serpin B